MPDLMQDVGDFPLSPILKYKLWQKPSAETKTPNRNEFSLRKEIVEFRANDNKIAVTFCNYGFMDFVLTWAKHLSQCGVDNILVGAMDSKLLESLFRLGIPVFDVESDHSTQVAEWDSPLFNKMGRDKVVLINAFLAMGFELLITDADVVFQRNPWPFFERWPTADIFSSSDELVGSITTEEDGLDDWQKVSGEFNIGLLLLRPTVPSRRLAIHWAHQVLLNASLWDQLEFNNLLNLDIGLPVIPAAGQEKGLVWAFESNLQLGMLPVALFCSGHTYFVQRLPQQLKLHEYSVHTTFQFSGAHGKRHRLRESMLLFDEPEYYDPAGGLLSLRLDIPSSLLHPMQFNLSTHFNLLNFQLRQIRALFALATILNRTAILPPLWCHYDRLWYSHPGILPHTHTQQPFLCPLDHVFLVDVMASTTLDKDEYGPAIRFREHSFLDNSRTSQQVKESKLAIGLCANNSNCAVNLPAGSSQAQIVSLLANYSNVKVLELVSPCGILGEWNNESDRKKFRWRISHYLSYWCCQDSRDDHIWYDFFADEDPNWQPYPVEDEDEDHPAYTEKP